jgi:hypothetical protein
MLPDERANGDACMLDAPLTMLAMVEHGRLILKHSCLMQKNLQGVSEMPRNRQNEIERLKEEVSVARLVEPSGGRTEEVGQGLAGTSAGSRVSYLPLRMDCACQGLRTMGRLISQTTCVQGSWRSDTSETARCSRRSR